MYTSTWLGKPWLIQMHMAGQVCYPSHSLLSVFASSIPEKPFDSTKSRESDLGVILREVINRSKRKVCLSCSSFTQKPLKSLKLLPAKYRLQGWTRPSMMDIRPRKSPEVEGLRDQSTLGQEGTPSCPLVVVLQYVQKFFGTPPFNK